MARVAVKAEVVLAASSILVPVVVHAFATYRWRRECACCLYVYLLQVEILRMLRILGTKHADASDQMNDILAQVGNGFIRLARALDRVARPAIRPSI